MWLTVRFPLLPLETLYTSEQITQEVKQHTENDYALQKAPQDSPQVVIENSVIYCLNQSAYECGIRSGHSLSNALALCQKLKSCERSIAQEKQRLRNLAVLVYQFSSTLSINYPVTGKNESIQDHLLTLEIGRSLKLYQGVDNLLSEIGKQLDNEKTKYQFGIGYNEKSARLLSQVPLEKSLNCLSRGVQHICDEPAQKALLQLICEQPIGLMEVDPATIEKLSSVGFRSINDLYRIPQATLTKRFGRPLCNYLMQLFDTLKAPIKLFTPPESFHQKIEFIDVIHQRAALSYPIKRLTKDLAYFLRLKQKQCQCLYWELYDSEKNIIGFDVLLSESNIDENIYLELTMLNLERYSLHAPIEAIALSVNQLYSLNTDNKNLFDEYGDFKQDAHFISKIKAKLGASSCYQISVHNEHVPELATQVVTETAQHFNESTETNKATYTYPQSPNFNYGGSTAIDFSHQTIPSRPAWLLEKPKPINFNQTSLLYQGKMKIISAQEKVTQYWWKKEIARDYYLAEHEDGTIYWVFFDQLKQCWFLHGIYG
ncbi:DNA polymerase Y family protein [Aliikangiella sp. G2MR2-5]|uniref:Y-family DNA polymerase n=1 Tax=Aliikangiella sp. G2MR2-5 TaxID=2788943 RepID=UPI0018AB25E4|nr:DNA polymerase Y family protein [Aliikangiella sp. G2MR2-5]